MRRIGLVLGAGGTAGQAYHAGVLTALSEAGWDPRTSEIIVGTSAGSLVAALMRAGMPVSDLTTGRYRQGDVRRHGAASDVAERSTAAPAAAVGLAVARPNRARLGGRIAGMIPPGRLSPGGIIALVRHVAADRWPGRTTWICAVRRSDGRRVVFGRDGAPDAPFSKAVAASCAIPGYFQPVLIDGVEYVDGGAHSPTNLDLVAGLGLDLVVVSSPMSVSGITPPRRLDLPARMLFRATLARERVTVRRHGTRVLSFEPTVDDLRVTGLNAMDPRHWHDIVEAATVSTRRRLEEPATRRQLLG